MDTFVMLDLMILLVLLVFSALFSAGETALTGLGRIRLTRAIEQGGPRGRALEQWKQDPNRILTTILVMNNALNISASTIAAFMAIHLSDLFRLSRTQMGVATAAAVTVVIIIFGEITPKILSIQKTERIALAVIQPLAFLEKMLRPFTRLLIAVSNVLLRPFGVNASKSVPMVTEDEIRAMIEMGADEGVIETQEHQMIHGVIRLGKTQVREVMVPRTQMACIDADDTMDRIIDEIIREGYSRMPVYRESVDNVIGVVYTKDIISILQNRELIVLQDVLRQPYFVPETKKVDELLKEFQRGHLHMAIVVDEYGGTSGLVTLEDLIEEIVGEISDEYDILDVPEKLIERVDESTWRVSGHADIKDINETLDIALPDTPDVNTIAGYVTELLGHLPQKGEEAVHGQLLFTILAATTRKIDKIQIRKLPPEAAVTED